MIQLLIHPEMFERLRELHAIKGQLRAGGTGITGSVHGYGYLRTE